MKLALDERAEILLKTLIQRYINEGQPVGSRVLAREVGLDISPATVRNVMSDLEEMGLIQAPHTSAGRIPTEMGYRMFVDSLITVHSLDGSAPSIMWEQFGNETDPKQLLENASNMMSNITHFAGVVLVPKHKQSEFRQVEFLSLSSNRVLTILVTDDGRVQNRVIHVDRNYSSAELDQAARYFNETFTGCSLEHVRNSLLLEMKTDSDSLNHMMKTAVAMAQDIFMKDQQDEDDVVVSGEMNLLEVPELCDLEKIRKLLDAFRTKQDLLGLLDKSMKASGIQIFIGDESGYTALDGCSVVTSSYTVDGEVIGTLGVIGPTRMSYDKVIPIVDITARLLGSALSSPMS